VRSPSEIRTQSRPEIDTGAAAAGEADAGRPSAGGFSPQAIVASMSANAHVSTGSRMDSPCRLRLKVSAWSPVRTSRVQLSHAEPQFLESVSTSALSDSALRRCSNAGRHVVVVLHIALGNTMIRLNSVRRLGVGWLLLLAFVRPVAAQTWPPDSLTNLKVLPKDIKVRDLVTMMAGFTRALGVRCTYCHVGEESQPLEAYRFASDDKPAKRKARVMLQMVDDLNGRYLSTLEARHEPPVRVECVTCHRGTTEPRTLQDVLLLAYRTAGLDSTIATYRALRQKYYGRSSYDFGEVPLADVAGIIWDQGQPVDAVRLYALNVEMNPASAFAKRQHASLAITRAYRTGGIDSGVVRYRELKTAYSAALSEDVMNQIGFRLLNAGQVDLAISAFKLNVEAFPQSANAWDSLGDGYARHGDRQLAIDSYVKSLSLDSTIAATKKKLDALRGKPLRG
jgi:tetratricopeptide (TPR) repeat protein